MITVKNWTKILCLLLSLLLLTQAPLLALAEEGTEPAAEAEQGEAELPELPFTTAPQLYIYPFLLTKELLLSG